MSKQLHLFIKSRWQQACVPQLPDADALAQKRTIEIKTPGATPILITRITLPTQTLSVQSSAPSQEVRFCTK